VNTAGTHAVPRIIAGVAAIPFTLFTLMALPDAVRGRFDALSVTFAALFATASIFCWWFAIRGHLGESRRRMGIALAGGFVLGAIGFVAGFIGPILVAPGANQGPLLGIFITGPLGFVLGAGIGWIYSFRGRRA